jgi:hypothetical protein
LSAAGSAIIGISSEANADTGAIGLTGWARCSTHPTYTKLAGCTLSTTFATIVDIGVGIDTDTRTQGQSSGADAFAGRADLKARAFDTASTAVIAIRGCIYALVGTNDLSRWARESAFTRTANLAGGAFSVTSTAVIEISKCINADTGAIS